MQELTEFASAVNFGITNFELDGKIHRFDRNGTKNAWYVGWQLFGTKSGQSYYVAILGDWKTGEKHEYRSAGQKFSREDSALFKHKIIEAQEKAEADRKMHQDAATKYAEKIWATAKPIFKSPYFERKKIADLHGTRTTLDTKTGERVVIVPMCDVDGKLWGCQRIYEDGSKRFLTSQRTTGLFHVIGDMEASKTAYLCEGFATGASIYQAISGAVLVAFNAGNLEHVAKDFRRKYLNKALIVCSDKDLSGVGQKKAEQAAKVALGSIVYPDGLENGTDFNDLHVEKDIETVRSQILKTSAPDKLGYLHLGFEGSHHYFYVSRSRDIKVLGAFSTQELFQLMPLEYWETNYGTKKGVRWDQAKSDLIATSNKIGPFDPFRVRGTGVWQDRDRVVVNTGQGDIDSNHYVYVATKNKMRPIHAEPLTASQCRPLLGACESLKWRDENSGILLAGWVAISRIAGALPIRPHIWLTGSSGSGKSSIMDKLIRPALGSEAGRLYLQGGSTEAGIRQAVKADSIPIIFDEFETTDENSKQRTAALIELLRQSWSQTEGHVVKGSAGGEASYYAMSFAALVSSIRTALVNDADRSRFCVLELAPHDNDPAHWKMVKKYLIDIDEDFGERLFSRQLGRIDIILHNYEMISDVLAGVVSRRFGQQWGMLLAGWFSLYSDLPITKEQAESLPDDLGLREEKESSEVTDEIECHLWLMEHRPRVYGYVGDERRIVMEKSITKIIEDFDGGEIEQLKDMGIIVDYTDVYISSNHSYLKKYVFKGTRWENCFYQTLTRLTGATKVKGAKRFKHHISASVKLPRT